MKKGILELVSVEGDNNFFLLNIENGKCQFKFDSSKDTHQLIVSGISRENLKDLRDLITEELGHEDTLRKLKEIAKDNRNKREEFEFWKATQPLTEGEHEIGTATSWTSDTENPIQKIIGDFISKHSESVDCLVCKFMEQTRCKAEEVEIIQRLDGANTSIIVKFKDKGFFEKDLMKVESKVVCLCPGFFSDGKGGHIKNTLPENEHVEGCPLWEGNKKDECCLNAGVSVCNHSCHKTQKESDKEEIQKAFDTLNNLDIPTEGRKLCLEEGPSKPIEEVIKDYEEALKVIHSFVDKYKKESSTQVKYLKKTLIALCGCGSEVKINSEIFKGEIVIDATFNENIKEQSKIPMHNIVLYDANGTRLGHLERDYRFIDEQSNFV